MPKYPVFALTEHKEHRNMNPKNTICIVSWQAPNTMGRRLADREPQVNIFGDVYKRNCDVATIGGLSGHAGQELLVKYAMGVKGTVKQIFLVHGEEKQAMTLKGLLNERKLDNVHYPDLHDSVDV